MSNDVEIEIKIKINEEKFNELKKFFNSSIAFFMSNLNPYIYFNKFIKLHTFILTYLHLVCIMSLQNVCKIYKLTFIYILN